jgi:nitrogen fixation protein NifU and related proteins
MISYTETLKDHFLNPRHAGEIDNPDGIGYVGDPHCGDFLKVTIRVRDEHISDIAFKCQGCPAAIGTASAMTEMAIGKSLDEASEITDEMIENKVGGLPGIKKHCSNLGANALYEAIIDYIHKNIRGGEFVHQGMDIFTPNVKGEEI